MSVGLLSLSETITFNGAKSCITKGKCKKEKGEENIG
jgi:hypothetical protein